jgi:hypothetical protein
MSLIFAPIPRTCLTPKIRATPSPIPAVPALLTGLALRSDKGRIHSRPILSYDTQLFGSAKRDLIGGFVSKLCKNLLIYSETGVSLRFCLSFRPLKSVHSLEEPICNNLDYFGLLLLMLYFGKVIPRVQLLKCQLGYSYNAPEELLIQ